MDVRNSWKYGSSKKVKLTLKSSSLHLFNYIQIGLLLWTKLYNCPAWLCRLFSFFLVLHLGPQSSVPTHHPSPSPSWWLLSFGQAHLHPHLHLHRNTQHWTFTVIEGGRALSALILFYLFGPIFHVI